MLSVDKELIESELKKKGTDIFAFSLLAAHTVWRALTARRRGVGEEQLAGAGPQHDRDGSREAAL